MKKSIVITVDETTLVAIDRLARGSGRRLPGKRANRSEVVRRAVQESVARHQRLAREEKDRRILGARRDLIERQAAALVAGQAGRARPPARC